MGGGRHDEAQDRAVVIEDRSKGPPGHSPVTGLGVRQVAFARQGPVLVAALKGLSDLAGINMVDPDGIFIRNGDVVQVIGVADDTVQIFDHIRPADPGAEHVPDGGGTAKTLDRGDQDLIDLSQEGLLGITHGHRHGHRQQRDPADHHPDHHLPKERQTAFFLFFHGHPSEKGRITFLFTYYTK